MAGAAVATASGWLGVGWLRGGLLLLEQVACARSPTRPAIICRVSWLPQVLLSICSLLTDPNPSETAAATAALGVCCSQLLAVCGGKMLLCRVQQGLCRRSKPPTARWSSAALPHNELSPAMPVLSFAFVAIPVTTACRRPSRGSHRAAVCETDACLQSSGLRHAGFGLHAMPCLPCLCLAGCEMNHAAAVVPSCRLTDPLPPALLGVPCVQLADREAHDRTAAEWAKRYASA